MTFEWDIDKEQINIAKHGVDFQTAILAFLDPNRIIANDDAHSYDEPRSFCYGDTGEGILTARFTLRGDKIRIFGAGYWRKGKMIYEKGNSNLH
jgi:uncharacterized DUF497 family protein